MSAKQRCCSTCGLPCKGHVGPCGPRCGGGGGGGNTVRRDVTQYGTPTGIHNGLRTTTVQERSCTTCGRPCKGHNGPYGPSCQYGGRINEKEISCTKCGQPCKGHAGPYGPSCQQGPHTEISCTTCGRPCKGHIGPYGPSCQQGIHAVVKERSCSTCGKPCKGHDGPYGPSCQQGLHAAVKERSCTTCGQPCKGHIGPYGPSCQQGRYADTKERCCTTCGKPCKGHDGRYGPSCQQGPHIYVKERSCTTCGQPCKGHIGPYGPSCQQGRYTNKTKKYYTTYEKPYKKHDEAYKPNYQQEPHIYVKERSCSTCGNPCNGHDGPYGPTCNMGQSCDDIVMRSDNAGAASELTMNLDILGPIPSASNSVNAAVNERSCTTCGQPCKGHIGPYGPSCQQGRYTNKTKKYYTTYEKPYKKHDEAYKPNYQQEPHIYVKERSCSTCGNPCNGHDGPYGPTCNMGQSWDDIVMRSDNAGAASELTMNLDILGPIPSASNSVNAAVNERSCTTCGQPCKGHIGPYGPSCQQGLHAVVKERSCSTCGKPCKGHDGPYGPSCQQEPHIYVKEGSCSTSGNPCNGHDGPCGPTCKMGQSWDDIVMRSDNAAAASELTMNLDLLRPIPSASDSLNAVVKERSCTTCGQPCKGHIGPYGPSCQQGRYADTKERCCTTCGKPCNGHDGPYGPSCKQGPHIYVKEISCSTSGKPCNGHDGPYGPTCNMDQSWDDIVMRSDNAGAASDLSMNLDLLGPIPSASASRDSSKDCHNVITLNMGGPAISAKRKETILKIMDKASPGIAFFQEVICPVRDEWLNDLLDRYQWVNTGDNIQAGVMWDTDTFKQRMTFDAAAKQKILQRAAISRKYDGGISDIATRACVVYLQPNKSGTNSGVLCVSWHGPNVGKVDSRCEIWRALQDFSLQARRLVQMRTGQTQVPIIIAGDFNLPLEIASDSRQLSDKLSLSQYQQSKRRTDHKKKNIDYFAYTKDIQLLDVKPDVTNDPEETLDHDPITASLNFDR